MFILLTSTLHHCSCDQLWSAVHQSKNGHTGVVIFIPKCSIWRPLQISLFLFHVLVIVLNGNRWHPFFKCYFLPELLKYTYPHATACNTSAGFIYLLQIWPRSPCAAYYEYSSQWNAFLQIMPSVMWFPTLLSGDFIDHQQQWISQRRCHVLLLLLGCSLWSQLWSFFLSWMVWILHWEAHRLVAK